MNTLTPPHAPQTAAPPDPATVRVRRIGIHTYQEPVIYMHADCAVCRSEGFEAESRVRITCAGRSMEATLNVVTSDLLSTDEAALSESAWLLLGAEEGAWVRLSHPEPLESFAQVRAKLYGATLDEDALRAVVRDVAAQRYTAIQVAAFVAACAGGRMNPGEVLGLTRAMVDAGERLAWPRTPVVDKHCVGGLPGNRTTPIVVAIVAACGLLIPKTSSRAITSPAGTADAMATLAPVDLDVEQMRAVVEREGGCVVWGGAVRLSPADDILIRVERPLDLDSEAQLVASVLSKKVAAGSTHVVIDVPVGPTAKVRTAAAADALGGALLEVGAALGLWVGVIRTDGSQPVGRGIGPALEARDVVAVLSGAPDAPADLRERAVLLSGAVLEAGGAAPAGGGAALAAATLEEGRAWTKFQAICRAQGGMREPPRATHTRPVLALTAGRVAAVDNRRLARAAKLAGAPAAPAAGALMHARVGDLVERGQPLFTLHAATPGELAYAGRYVDAGPPIMDVREDG